MAYVLNAVTSEYLLSLYNASLQSSNGYVRVPINISGAFNEIIIQWGSDTIESTGTVITLPITYPNAHLVALGNGDVAGITMVIQSTTTSNFTGWKSGAGSASCSWISIGY